MRFTKGEKPDIYTDKELQHCLNRYLLKENQISDDFMNQIMLLKVLFVGGEVNFFSRSELNSFIEYAGRFKNEMIKLNIQWKLLLFAKGQATPDELSKNENLVNQAFENFKENIKSYLSRTQVEHRLKDWYDLLLNKYQVKNLIAEI
jgi:hypothetical protein